jgi:hypothetical protein
MVELKINVYCGEEKGQEKGKKTRKRRKFKCFGKHTFSLSRFA